MPVIDVDGVKVWRRDPYKQSLARDLIGMEATYARACNASREYFIVKVPILSYDALTDKIEVDTSKCSEDESRFIYGNVTPREYERARNEALANNGHYGDYLDSDNADTGADVKSEGERPSEN